jgi:hypothetical protein
MRVCMPQGLVGGIDHPRAGRIIARNGIADVPDHIARDLIRFDGCFPAAGKPSGVDGFICVDCGFHAYYRTCGRCGGECVRPHEIEGSHAQALR